MCHVTDLPDVEDWRLVERHAQRHDEHQLEEETVEQRHDAGQQHQHHQRLGALQSRHK